MSSVKEQSGSTPQSAFIYTREDATQILQSDDQRDVFIDPLSLPIAGLRAIPKDERYPTLSDVPKEILSPAYQPVVLVDLDDNVWRHAMAIVHSVGELTEKPITAERYRSIGNTRKVPEWKDDPEIMAVHDAVVRGEHPTHYPYVNSADDDAVRTLHAIERMGHTFAYITARPRTVLAETLRVIRWNRMPVAAQDECIDPIGHEMPRDGCVYCGDDLPMVDGKRDHKQEAVRHWLSNLEKRGWRGTFVVIDDLLSPFQELIERGKIVGIRLMGDVNQTQAWIPGEIRVHSWREISDYLAGIHEKTLISDPSPYRQFEHGGKILYVDKKHAGPGVFTLRTVPESAYYWQNPQVFGSTGEIFSGSGREDGYCGNATGL